MRADKKKHGRSLSIGTALIYAARFRDRINHPASDPVYQSTGWEFESLAEAFETFDGDRKGVSYATLGGIPNNVALESALRLLHHAEDAIAMSGGMSALAITFMAHLRPGSRVLVSRDVFGLTSKLLRQLSAWGVEAVFLDLFDEESLDGELSRGVDMLVAETISNPLTRVPDLSSICNTAHRHGATVLVDNTFAGPYHCRPLEHGADLVIESLSKTLSGHNDAVLGAIVGSSALLEPVRSLVQTTATSSAPHVAWLGTRGLMSYELRQERASTNALQLARFLESREEIDRVFFPGLETHPDHEIASTLLSNGFGTVLSFRLKDGCLETIESFLAALSNVRIVMTLGGPATIISHPASMTHRALSPDERSALGIGDDLLRVAVGIESADDVIADFAGALDAISVFESHQT